MTQMPQDGYLEPDGRVTPLPPMGAAAPSTSLTKVQPGPSLDDDALARRALKIVRARRELRHAVLVFAAVNAGLWAFYLINSVRHDFDFPWPIFVTVFWGMSLLFKRREVRELETEHDEVADEMARLRQRRQTP